MDHPSIKPPSFGLSVRTDASPVGPTKLQVLHTCTKKKLKNHSIPCWRFKKTSKVILLIFFPKMRISKTSGPNRGLRQEHGKGGPNQGTPDATATDNGKKKTDETFPKALAKRGLKMSPRSKLFLNSRRCLKKH